MYCLWDAIELFLRAELHAGIYDSSHNLGKQSVCQHKYSEQFQQPAIWPRDGKHPGEQLEQAPSWTLQKPSFPFTGPQRQSLTSGSHLLTGVGCCTPMWIRGMAEDLKLQFSHQGTHGDSTFARIGLLKILQSLY